MKTDLISFEAFTSWALSAGIRLLCAIAVLLIGWWVSRLLMKGLKGILEKSRIDGGATSFICSVVKVILWIVIVLTALSQMGININSMVAALGAAGLTASFALQGSLGNFVSGMQVIFSKPFGIGDFLSVDDQHMGTVKAITVLNTTLMTPDNKEIIIPNSILTSGMVVNYTSQKARRLDLSYSISYTADIDLALSILRGLTDENDKVLRDPAPIIAVGAHNPSSLELVAKLWVDAELYWDLYYEMQEKVKRSFDAKGVQIPFPQMDVHIKEAP